MNGAVMKSYETGPGVSCVTDTVAVSPGDTLAFKCKPEGMGKAVPFMKFRFTNNMFVCNFCVECQLFFLR